MLRISKGLCTGARTVTVLALTVVTPATVTVPVAATLPAITAVAPATAALPVIIVAPVTAAVLVTAVVLTTAAAPVTAALPVTAVPITAAPAGGKNQKSRRAPTTTPPTIHLVLEPEESLFATSSGMNAWMTSVAVVRNLGVRGVTIVAPLKL